jgi:RHS repeat-associated protein
MSTLQPPEIRNKHTARRDRAPQQLIRYTLESHLGSGSVELDDEARILSFEEYTLYESMTYQGGGLSLKTPKRYRFTGKERDEESRCNYHCTRYYTPCLGQWYSADPPEMEEALNLHLYRYEIPVSGWIRWERGDEDFKELEELHKEVGEIYANKSPPAPDPNPMSKEEHRRVPNTKNKRLHRNPPPETPLDLVDARQQLPPWR